jgi:hypothetical protein
MVRRLVSEFDGGRGRAGLLGRATIHLATPVEA